ncbi:DUF4142 domain-containing protein [Streptomyces sp. NPDC015131]|uniref:DUF4142 domain-containing protein n=1 Tax=Streptomyces sp. NPDC015131 TaxID=3364941 RepID=UPI003700BAB6
MIRTPHWAATALTCLALSGIAAGHAAPALASAPADGASTALATDAAFLRASHQGNLTEIAAGKDARKHATTDCVKQVGEVLVRDHTKLDADTRALADDQGVDLPMAPSKEQQQTLADLRAKAGGPAYDAAWLKAQAAAHEKTLARIDNQIARGENARVTAAAKAARPVVAMHLGMVRGGTCHTASAPHTIHAGNGGHVSTSLAAEVPVAVAVPVVAVGGVLVAGGAFWAASRMRRNDNR